MAIEELRTGSHLTQGLGSTDARPMVRRTWFPERNSLRLSSLVLLILIWWIVSLHMKPLFLPGPKSVAVSFVDLFKDGQLGNATVDSLFLLLAGLGISMAIGIPVGILTGRRPGARYFTESLITIFWATPSIALLPLFIIWFGLSYETQLLIVVLSAVFPIILSTGSGVAEADPNLLAMAAIFNATTFEKMRFIVLPSAMGSIVTGLRVGIGRAIIGVLVAELFTGSTGLGARMSYYGNLFQTSNYFAALVMFVIFSLVITEMITVVERRFSKWRD